MEGALSALILPSTWVGTSDEIKLAISRAITLRSIIGQADVLVSDVEAPYWDDEADADDELPPDEQPWYGVLIDDTFQATIENWVIAAFVAYAAGPGAALTFLTLAKSFRLALRKHDLGGIIRVFVNAADAGTVDTYSATPGILEVDYVGDPDEDEQQILLVLEEAPALAFAAGELPTGAPMQVIRKKLSSSEVSNPNLRYDPTCNCIQQTTDGGTSWVDQPGADVRHNDAWRLPASSSPDARCDAAARIVAAWQAVLEQLYQTTNVSIFASGVLQILLLLAGGAGVLIDLIILVLEGLITIGVSNIQAAFTSDVWDGIQCIIYCNIGDDGQVSEEQRQAILDDVAVQYPGTVYNTLVLLQDLFGEVLMSNAGVERTETGDCDECDCGWCYEFDFTLSDGDWQIFVGGSPTASYATYVSGEGWRSNFFPTPFHDNVQALIVYIDFPPTTLTRIGWEEHGFGGSNVSNELYADSVLSDLRASGSPWVGNEGWQTICFYLQWFPDPTDSSPIFLTKVRINGLGENPFGDDNCS